ncbi:MAG: NAD-dependent epimerase/dehydratase family protein [Beijerinckiaceae bacterium]
MKILITGGSGFVGSKAGESLASRGHAVLLPLRRLSTVAEREERGITRVLAPPVEQMRIEDWLPLLDGVDAVVHSAAIAHIGPSIADERYQAVNAHAAGVLAEAAAAAGVGRFVFLSSIRAQVGPASVEVQCEATLAAPTEAYGCSKLEGERLVRRSLPSATILRPLLVVGPGAAGNLPLLERLARLPLPLPFGAFSAPQAMVCLDNLVEAIRLGVETDMLSGEIFLAAEEPHPSIADVIGWLRAGVGRKPGLLALPPALLRLPFNLIGKTNVFERLEIGMRVDASKLRAAGWVPQRSLESVFREMGARP